MTNILKSFFSIENKKDKFDFLDGYRGSLAVWVLMHHGVYGFGIFPYFELTGLYIGVIGFFILSSFLLTYNLLIHFYFNDEKENGFKNNFLIILIYSIRRIFRIYIPFVVFVALVKFEPSIKWGGNYNSYDTFINIITLQNSGSNHLWTIASEIKYYFFIPIYSFIAYKIMLYNQNYWFYINLILSLLGLIYQVYYYIGLQSFLIFTTGYEFGTRFLIFYCGSLLATFYYQFKLENRLVEYTENSLFKFKIGLITCILYFIGAIIWSHKFNPHVEIPFMTYLAGFYWTIMMGLMLIGAPNFFTNIFNLKCLKYTGKFSFGIYLLHPMCIEYLKELFQNENNSFDSGIIIYYIIASFFCGLIFFYFVENLLMKLANSLVKLIQNLI